MQCSTCGWKRMQGYSVRVAVQSEPTKQARWIIIQMFWTGTLNGMRSHLASCKILITHLISHCTSSGPGGAPVCVCVCVCVCEREQREDVWCCNHLNNMVYISVSGNANETKGEICHSLSCVFFSPCVRLPTPHLPQHIVNSTRSQVWWITCSTVCISFSWYSAVIDFSWVSMYYREALCARVWICVCVCTGVRESACPQRNEVNCVSLPTCIGLCRSIIIEHVHPVEGCQMDRGLIWWL